MDPIGQLVRRKEAVVFDLFRTLTAPAADGVAAGRPTYEILGVPPSAWAEQMHRSRRARFTGEQTDPVEIIAGMARAIDPAISDETILEAVANRRRRFEAELLNVPGEAVELLRALRSKGKKLGLISNTDALEIQPWGGPLAEMFDSVLFSCRVGAVKPERRIYEVCLEELGVGPDEALYVGDGG
jgi:putative hydrolase of the HAD superfamily